MLPKRFNIRVYGLLIRDEKEILITDECRYGQFFTKFPGGGLEYGESIHDCLKREFQEELGIEISIHSLYYLTDFFVQSAFVPEDQIISIYYLIDYSLKNQLNFAKYNIPFSEEIERFRWMPLKNLDENKFTFPIDKHVVELLKGKFETYVQ